MRRRLNRKQLGYELTPEEAQSLLDSDKTWIDRIPADILALHPDKLNDPYYYKKISYLELAPYKDKSLLEAFYPQGRTQYIIDSIIKFYGLGTWQQNITYIFPDEYFWLVEVARSGGGSSLPSDAFDYILARSVSDPSYEPVAPITQVQGVSDRTFVTHYYKKDSKGVIFAVYSPLKGTWIQKERFLLPISTSEALDTEDRKEIYDTLTRQTNYFKTKTEYILIGDEPDPKSCGVVSIESKMTPEQLAGLKSLFSHLPRMYLRGWFDKNVVPNLSARGATGTTTHVIAAIYGPEYLRPKRLYEDLIWAAFIDFFNKANLEYCNTNKLEPWTWEDEKLKAYFVSESEPDLVALDNLFKDYQEVNVPKDTRAAALIEEFNTLPKLGDLGLEISRQNAIRELLVRKEYDVVQAIIEAYRYAHYTVLDKGLRSPIPFDIVSSDGRIVKATPTPG